MPSGGVYESNTVSPAVSEARSQRVDKNTSPFSADPASWHGKSVLSVSQFPRAALELLLSVADDMKAMVADKSDTARLSCQPPLRGRVLGTLFYENSTRTCCSFQAAMLRLGGTFIAADAISSSVKKGETLEDTVMCLLSYCDAIVLRHPQKGAARAAAGVATRPVLNAGDGVGEHPTQALLDLYTIVSELKLGNDLSGLRGKVVVMIGDLKHGRTVHSLSWLLAGVGAVLRYVSPEALAMPESVTQEVAAAAENADSVQTAHEELDTVLPEADVLYVTRIQRERFASQEEFEAVNGYYCITPEVLERAKESAVLMHPLPRVGEISEGCDLDPRAAYFRQMENGMFVRMALLTLLLGKAS